MFRESGLHPMTASAAASKYASGRREAAPRRLCDAPYSTLTTTIDFMTSESPGVKVGYILALCELQQMA